MATITRSLSSKVNGNGESEIMLRLSVSRDLRLRLKSGIFVEGVEETPAYRCRLKQFRMIVAHYRVLEEFL